MALDFVPASTSRLALTRTTAIEPLTNTLTITARVRLDGSPNSAARIAEKEYNNGNSSPYISYGLERGSSDVVWFNIGTGSGLQQAGGNTAMTGNWQILVGVYDGTLGSNNGVLYIDGSAESTTFTHSNTISYHTGAGNFDIGGNSGGGNHFDGQIAEVCVWNAALGTDEIDALFSKWCARLIRPTKQLIYIPLWGTTGAEWVNGLATSYTGVTNYDHPQVIYPGKTRYFIPTAAAAPSFGTGATRIALCGAGYK